MKSCYVYEFPPGRMAESDGGSGLLRGLPSILVPIPLMKETFRGNLWGGSLLAPFSFFPVSFVCGYFVVGWVGGGVVCFVLFT